MVDTLYLQDSVDKNQLEVLMKKDPRELVPQLGTVVRDLVERKDEHIRTEALPFVMATVLTDNFKKILHEVYSSLQHNSPFIKFLNLDMGSGKTHLLVLTLYSIYAYDELEHQALDGLKELGLNEELARRVAVFPIDLRTPAMMPTFLRLFGSSLEKIGEIKAAEYVLECSKRGEMPSARELIERLKRSNTQIVVLVDELHHAVLTYRGETTERLWVEKTIEFLNQLISYSNYYRRGLVILVASARSDVESVKRLETRDDLIIKVENLEKQLGRFEPIIETQWLSTEEAKRIILKKLGARRDIFHKTMDKFITRVIKADTDIPQAQHLRSLIKAMAVYTYNAIQRGDNIVTPAHFDEKVVSALFPADTQLAMEYKSIYDHVRHEIEERIEDDSVREAVRLAANAVFTSSITGRPDLLIGQIKAYKFGEAGKEIPGITDKEIEEILESLGLGKGVSDVLDHLEELTYIHRVKREETYLYFAVTIESIASLFNSLIEKKFRDYRFKLEELISSLQANLWLAEGASSSSAKVLVASQAGDLDSVVEKADLRTFYAIIVNDVDLLKHVHSSLREPTSRDISELNRLISEWFSNKGLKSPAKWLEEKGRPNFSVIIPVVTDRVLEGLAYFQAVEEAIKYIVEQYLIEYKKGERGRLAKELRAIMEAELSEIHEQLQKKGTEALSRLLAAIASALSLAYIYKCKTEPAYSCFAEPTGVGITPPKITPVVVTEEYEKLLENLEYRKEGGIKDILSDLIEKVKTYCNLVEDPSKMRTVIVQFLKDKLRESREVQIPLADETIWLPVGGTVYWAPRDVVDKSLRSISPESLERDVGARVEVEQDKNSWVFRLGEVRSQMEAPIVESQKIPAKALDPVQEALITLDSLTSGVVKLELQFDEKSKYRLKQLILSVKGNIRSIKVEAS